MSSVNSNSFDLSHDVKLSMNMGELVPVNLIECIPGDVVNMSTSVMARLAPMLAPVMHKVDIDLHHFFVPNRILWDNWEKFITTGTPDENTPAAPYFNYGAYQAAAGSLLDYMGLPLEVNLNTNINALPIAAFQKIWWEYYRDQNLQFPTMDFPKLQDGLNSVALSPPFDGFIWDDMRKRAWEHDYFTSALPFAQKGDEVELGLTGSADIQLKGNTYAGKWVNTSGSTVTAGLHNITGGYSSGNPVGDVGVDVGGTSIPTIYDPNGSLEADLSTASAVTINQLRWAIRLQEYLERNARGGTRYIEHILAHFGVHSSDKRLQRPEFLGGSRQNMIISEVLQNAPGTETDDTPQGNMAGHGLSFGQGKNFKYFVEEHGFIISICSIRPKTGYQQGIHRLWKRFDPLSYAYPTFAHLGEQEIHNYEIYFGDDSEDELTFGYTPRYSEYKYMASRSAGEFRTSLNYWHMNRIFSNRPHLNSTFIQSNPTTRIFAVDEFNIHRVYLQCFNNLFIRRRLPKFGIPTL